MTKYHNKKTVINGITFDSRREAERYVELKVLQKKGLITQLELQPKFLLQKGFKYRGKTQSAITYKADFRYIDLETNTYVVEDVKGMVTQAFAIKKKMFLATYGDIYDFRIVE